MDSRETHLLIDLQKAFSSAFANVESGYCLGSYDEVLRAVNSVSNDSWKDNDFDLAINTLINKGLFALVFSVESRQFKEDYNKNQSVLTFAEDAQRYIRLDE